MANTLIFNNGDHAERRPVVVVRSPVSPTDYVVFLQRTSTCLHLPGLAHPPDATLGLQRPGKWIFSYQRAVRADEFAGAEFEHRGALDPAYTEALLAAWEAQP